MQSMQASEIVSVQQEDTQKVKAVSQSYGQRNAEHRGFE
jgi:hypothetical protein